MNAYELADYLDNNVEAMLISEQPYIDNAANMLRQQADKIAELEKLVAEMKYEKSSGVYEKQSEPVAWMYQNASGEMKMLGNTRLEEWVTKFGCKEIPLYTTPQTKPLSDEEIHDIKYKIEVKEGWELNFARAIETKVRGQ